MTDWADLLRRVQTYACPCGSGGSMGCDDDCPGDTTSSAVRDALVALITEAMNQGAVGGQTTSTPEMGTARSQPVATNHKPPEP